MASSSSGHVGEHLQTMEVGMEAGELSHDTSSRLRGWDQGQVVGGRSNIHVQGEVGAGEAGVALDQRINSGESCQRWVDLVHLTKREGC